MEYAYSQLSILLFYSPIVYVRAAALVSVSTCMKYISCIFIQEI